ncbi:MAG: hypothetical protein ACREBJ_05005 [Nitrosotalea sp.]
MAIYDELDEDLLRELYINQNFRLTDLADYSGMSVSSIKRGLRFHGITKGRGKGRQTVRYVEEPEFLKTEEEPQYLSMRDVEFHIRKALSDTIDKAPTALIDALPVSYDPDEDIWVVNDYASKRKGHDLPIEIHIKYDYKNDRYNVEKFEIRGEPDKKFKISLQRAL